MKVRALRGVCIGVDRHLKAGDTADLDAAQVTFLAGIGAVERIPDDVAPAGSSPQLELSSEPKSTPAKPGKKEK